jgi:hypothetical protein
MIGDFMSCSEKLKGNQNQEKVRNKKDQHKRKTASPSESNTTSKIQVLILITLLNYQQHNYGRLNRSKFDLAPSNDHQFQQN